jgi:UDP-glucose:(heptosyl)LPS alpha-1,3-glucosyltransferase
MLLASLEWPENAWPNEYVVRLDGSSPLRFAHEVERAAEGFDVVFSLERILSCDIYRAGDGVHRAWLDRRAAFEPAWRRWTRWANSKHRELLRLEGCIFSPAKTNLVVANSRMVRDEIVAHYKYPAERIEIIPNGYDAPPLTEGLREQRRAELGIAPDAFVVLFAGSGWERKGLRTALEAIRNSPEVGLIVAGKGNAAAFRDMPEVHFIGPRQDLQPEFAAADVFVLPTIYDPFSNACLEASASGLPVITTFANGFFEIMTQGIHGTVIAPGDVKALVDAIRFWSSNNRAASARTECRRNAARYSVAENTRRTLDALTRAAQKR